MTDATNVRFPDQWYNQKPELFQAEIRNMHMHFPKAAYGFFRNNGNMYWIVTLSIFFTEGLTRPWQFLLVYDKDYPYNSRYGDSLKVVPIKPSLEELKAVARNNGRIGVPHVIQNAHYFLPHSLCLRNRPKAPKSEIAGAAFYAARAADWAAWFEVGIRDNRVWNKWCGNNFRYMRVPEEDTQ